MTAVQVIDSAYAAFSRGDIPYILSLVSPDATWHQAETLPWGGQYRGPAGVGEFFTKLNDAMETVRFEVRENIEHGDEVFSFGTYAGRSRKTGRTGSAEFMFRWRVRDGRIVAYDSWEDTAALVAAMV